jgi:hypothetical protein
MKLLTKYYQFKPGMAIKPVSAKKIRHHYTLLKRLAYSKIQSFG